MTGVYSVFGNPVRTRLIACIANYPKNVSELISVCGLTQSAVSQHLRKLKNAGIVATRKEGKEVYYRLKSQKAAKISVLLLELEKES
jgi:DNA-binding transcriptional ArsR family regulator